MSLVNRNGFTVQIMVSGSGDPAGVGFVAGHRHVVTCAHVVNKALGRRPREQERPAPGQLVLVEFVLLGGSGRGPVRRCRVEVWEPPPREGRDDGDDVAGLLIQGEGLPERAGPARLLDPLDQAIFNDPATKLFGFPSAPYRRPAGEWASCRLRGLVRGGMLQLEASADSVPVRPGFSGSPVVKRDGSGDAVIGMLVVAPDDEARDAYALPISRVLSAWPEVMRRREEAGTAPSSSAIPGSGATMGNVLGQLGQTAIQEALASLGADQSWAREPWTAEALHRLEGHLASQEDSTARTWVLRTVGDALVALETVKLLKSRRDLTSSLLRQALITLRASGALPSPVPACRTETEAVEAVAFGYPSDEPDCRQQMARFVLLMLAPGTGQIAEAISGDDEERAFRLWAGSDSIGWLQVNDAERFVRTVRRGQHLRLVVGLHTSLAGDWPESMEAWLRLDGEPYDHASFPLSTIDKAGAEKALGSALAWAHGLARDNLDGLELRRVDIAAPTKLLLSWRPEESVIGGALLGVRHDVIVHWSERLNPPEWRRWILDEASWRLANIDGRLSAAPVDWLTEEHTKHPDHLSGRLHAGHFMRAIGLDHQPDPQVMELLFSYIPIVLWPGTAAALPAPLRSFLDRCWETLPAGFLEAYRARWKEGRHTEDLAALRAVWDDSEWLKFCGECSRNAYL